MDIKLVEHAKDYIDDLANGINPFTKDAIDDNDIVNNVKISRCLFYVSSILDEVIKNGGINKSAKTKKIPFNVDLLNTEDIEQSQTPVTISVISKRINDITPENMSKLKLTAITNWLVDINMLEVVTVNNKNKKKPTSEGINLGITEKLRQGQFGVYSAVIYDETAQQFIIDNLSAIIDGGYNNRKSK